MGGLDFYALKDQIAPKDQIQSFISNHQKHTVVNLFGLASMGNDEATGDYIYSSENLINSIALYNEDQHYAYRYFYNAPFYKGGQCHNPSDFSNNGIKCLARYRAGWFSASYGPFRRLIGDKFQWKNLYNVAPRAATHITLFDESATLADVLDWVKNLALHRYKNQEPPQVEDPGPESARIFNGIRHFINESKLLLGKAHFFDVNNKGELIFRNANNHDVTVAQLSDGFRSILGVVLDLVRQLIRVYGVDKVFPPGRSDITTFPLPGVVLIDEVDAHLHPTWQTRIGQWFTKHFPEMQFIVTTHSPLICRACEHGTIWRLPPPGSEGGIEQITGAEKDRLVYGNVLDAYETQAFGAHMSRGEEGRHAQKEYLDLYYKRLYNVPMNEEEQARLEQLEAVFHSHVAIDED